MQRLIGDAVDANYGELEYQMIENDSMMQEKIKLPWTQTGWLDEATTWIREELMRLGMEVRGAIEQPHVRPWSTVLRASTFGGVAYFKAISPALGHEPALTQALWRWRDDCIPEVLAIDEERGWLLYLDMGSCLREQIQSIEGLRHWRKVLPLYAGLQIDMIEHVDELLDLGALDRRLEFLPRQFEALLDQRDTLRIDRTDGLSAGEYERLRALAPRFSDQCQALAAYAIPETLHHDDFHDGNVFTYNGSYILSDWGESCVAHPFFSMLVTLRSIAYRLKLDEDGGELSMLRDVYLDSWMDYASREDLLEAYSLANRVAMVNRALTWQRVIAQLEEPYRSEHLGSVSGWLQDFLEAEQAAD